MKVTSGWSNNCKDMLEVDSGQHGAKSITIACNSYLYQYAGFVKSSKDLRAYRVTRGWILGKSEVVCRLILSKAVHIINMGDLEAGIFDAGFCL